MIAWINFVVLLLAGAWMTYGYVKSVQPAALAQKIGPRAYEVCTRWRKLTMIPMGVVMINYLVYLAYPLPLPIPTTFGWAYGVSVALAVLVGLPSGYLMWRGMRDAGEETLVPRADHTLYGGIYAHIRHPQAVGELLSWWAITFLLNSPFLSLFNIVWIPVWWYWCVAEERDLVLRYGQPYAEYRARTGMFFPRRGGTPARHNS